MIYTALLYLLALLPMVTPMPHGPPGHKGDGHHGDKGNKLCGKTTCLANSLHDFSWTLSLEYRAFWYFTTPSHQHAWGTIKFNLTNPAVDATIQCQSDSNRLTDFFYGDAWYNCVPTAPVSAIPETTFRFLSHSRFDLNQTWTCDESLKTKKQKTIKFNALATTPLDMKCTDVKWQNPDWQYGTGAFYSTRDLTCEPVKLTLKPYEDRLAL